MSIAALYEVQQEVRRLFIAGSTLAADNFRLSKLLPPLKTAGEQTLIFSRVATAIEQVLTPGEELVAVKLLELATLVNAILSTQAETGITGEAQAIDTLGLPMPTKIPYRRLCPVIDALISTGAGRLEMIRQGYEDGVFVDLRAVYALSYALNDSYAEIADLAAQILVGYGTVIVPLLKRTIRMDGGKGDRRRLEVMAAVAGKTEQDYYIAAAANGSTEVKVGAIKALAHVPESLDLVLQYSRSKKKDIREAAIWTLAHFEDPAAVERFGEAFNGADREVAAGVSRQSPSKAVVNFLLRDAQRVFQLLIAAEGGPMPPTVDVKPFTKEIEHFAVILECLTGRQEPAVFDFLQKLLSHTDFFKQITVSRRYSQAEDSSIARMAAHHLLVLATPAALAVLEATRDQYDHYLIGYALTAAIRRQTAQAVFDTYAPYLQKANNAFIIKEMLPVMERYSHANGSCSLAADSAAAAEMPRQSGDSAVVWDSRWLKLLIKIDALSLVCQLAGPHEPQCIDYLLGKLETHGRMNDSCLPSIMRGLVQTRYADIMAVVTTVLEANLKRSGYYLYYLRQFADILRLLPPSCADQLAEIALRYETIKKDSAGARILQEVVNMLKSKQQALNDKESGK